MFRITVNSLSGKRLYFRCIIEYEVEDGYLRFIDPVTKKTKRFAVANTEIEEQ